ncbi:MAG: hypothetical protein SFU85_02320 [Candidatus Methylacidiphilales bacterium]|nr:hypothetical protein [Candidatus Methylacidiphilales bacterium]
MIKTCVEKTNLFLASIPATPQGRLGVIAAHIPKQGGAQAINMRTDPDFCSQLDTLVKTLGVPGAKCISAALSFCATRPARIGYAEWFGIGSELNLEGKDHAPITAQTQYIPRKSQSYVFLVESKILLYALLTKPVSTSDGCRTLLRRAIACGEIKLLTPDYDQLFRSIADLKQCQSRRLDDLNSALQAMVDIVPPPFSAYKLAAFNSSRNRKGADAYVLCAYATKLPKGIKPIVLTMDQQYLDCAAQKGISAWNPWGCEPVISANTKVLRHPDTGAVYARLTINKSNPDAVKMETD